MKVERRFPLQVLMACIVLAAVLAYPLARMANGPVTLAVIVGGALSTINVLLGFLTIEYAFDRSYTKFLKAVVGGMGIRMAFMLGALLVLSMGFHMHAVALTVSMVGFSAVYLVLEVLYLQKKVVVKNGDT